MNELVKESLGQRGWLKRIFSPNKVSMRLQHVIQEVYLKPVAMTAAGHAAVRKVIESKLADEYVATFTKAEDEEEDTDMFGEPLPVPYNLDEAGKIRVIPVVGPIAFKASLLERTCGITDAKLIKEWVMDAETDANVETIALDISSPGGTVTGVPELANFIAKCKKKTVAFTDDIMASAAYWIGAACDEVYSTPSAEVGSIGVYSYLVTMDRAYANEGIDAHLFKSGELKGLGLPGLPLSEKDKEYLQAEVDNLGAMFRNFVRERRGSVSDEHMQGQTLMGLDADKDKANLIDAVVDSLEDIFA